MRGEEGRREGEMGREGRKEGGRKERIGGGRMGAREGRREIEKE